MIVLPQKASELAQIAREVAATAPTGRVCYPETSRWQLGDLDLDEFLARFRDRKPVLIIATVSDVEPTTVTCGICGFVMNEVDECPRSLELLLSVASVMFTHVARIRSSEKAAAP